MEHLLAARIEILKSNIDSLKVADKGFAASLIAQYDKKGVLSVKQAYWVDKLADACQGVPDFTAPQPQGVTVGALPGLMTMFASAAKKLKHPSFVMQGPDQLVVRLSRATDSSQNPGCVYVKLAGSGQYLGKVTPDGLYVHAKDVGNSMREQVAQMLKDMSRRPAETAASFGALNGKCCFCSLPLSDVTSVAHGYGKTCASHYSLPWKKIK